MNPVFANVAPANVGRSVFDLSYQKKLTCDMGQLIPVQCDEVVPGDVWSMGVEAMIRFQAMVAPIQHEVNVSFHTFEVPYRLMWDDWEDFITGGEDGNDTSTIPTWNCSDVAVGSLWDYLGFPTGVTPDADSRPLDFPKRAYNMIWNEYYRDQNVDSEVTVDTSEDILYRRWEKDYFGSALPWQQRGTAPALPISGTTSAVWASGTFANAAPPAAAGFNTSADTRMWVNGGTPMANALGMFNDNTVDLSAATTFDVADLRLAFQIQKWMERNARAGARYVEFLRAHFGVAPRDERFQRPIYRGGAKMPVIVSEVLQTSSTDATSPQGNQAGHGMTLGREFTSKFRVSEFGLVMTLMSIMPKAAYSQGIDRQWLRSTRYDFYHPEFANLSEQAILRRELYLNGTKTDNETIFGYQGRYSEMRAKRDQISGLYRTTFNFWHLGREFSGAPLLNSSFLECDPRKDIFAVPGEPACNVTIGNRIKALRPLPYVPVPGLIDH
jgi:hypothetical protein